MAEVLKLEYNKGAAASAAAAHVRTALATCVHVMGHPCVPQMASQNKTAVSGLNKRVGQGQQHGGKPV
jgi:hypothetical protein